MMIDSTMTDRFLLLVLGSTLLLGMQSAAWGASGSPIPPRPDTLSEEPTTLILNQPDAPISLNRYEADYDGVRLFRSDGVRHEIAFQNATDQPIAAVKFKLVMYSVFYDVIAREDGVALDPLGSKEGAEESWTYDPPDAATFHVGAAYVSKVRFANGDLWESRSEAIDEQLSQIDRGQIGDRTED